MGYYTYHIRREDLRQWQTLELEFENVGGLKKKDPVMVNGARVGRVADVRLHKDGQLVVLEIDPHLVLHREGFRGEVVPLNALGRVAVDLDPGRADSPRITPADFPLPGRVRPSVGGAGAPSDDTRQALSSQIQGFARESEDLVIPEGGLIGSLAFDAHRAQSLDQGLSELSNMWTRVDEGLSKTRHADAGGFFSDESRARLVEAAHALRVTLGNAERGLAATERGQGVGVFLADPALEPTIEDFVQDMRRLWADAAEGRGTIGTLVQGSPRLDALTETVERVEQVTKKADEGEGLLGILSSGEAGKAVEEGLAGLEASTRRGAESVRDGSAAKELADTLGNTDDFILKLRQALQGLRDGLPDKTYQGVVFAIF